VSNRFGGYLLPKLKIPDEEVKILLHTAKDDLASAEREFAAENYHETISSLTQSIEKGSKSFFSYFDIVNSNKLKKEVGHLPTKGFEKSVDNIKRGYKTVEAHISEIEWKETREIPKFDIQKVEPNKREIKNLLSTISKNPSRFMTIRNKDMTKIISQLKNIQIDLEVTRQKIDNDDSYLTNIDDFQKDVFEVLKRQKIKPEIVEMIKVGSILFYEVFDSTYSIKDKAIVLHNIVNLTVTFLLLGFITQPHAISSRYPPKNFYTSKNILIKNFSEMQMITKNALNDMEEIFRISEKNAA
jgi:hypothetical protein